MATAFFASMIIIIVSSITMGRQYRSLTESHERELGPLRMFVEKTVLDLENISNGFFLVEDFHLRIMMKGHRAPSTLSRSGK